MPPEPAFAGVARALVAGHAVCALALLVAATQHARLAVRAVGGRLDAGLARLYATATTALYGSTLVLGLLAYPTFRYQVRGLFLDRHAPWASNLFDTKEIAAVLGLPVLAIAFGLARVLDDSRTRSLAMPYAVAAVLVAATAWFATVAGFVVAFTRGV
jgi:hypothetical protein